MKRKSVSYNAGKAAGKTMPLRIEYATHLQITLKRFELKLEAAKGKTKCFELKHEDIK